MNDGEWHHVAFAMSRGTNGEVAVYFDGKLVALKSCILVTVSTRKSLIGNFTALFISLLSHSNSFPIFMQ